jgi:hypothetical protein
MAVLSLNKIVTQLRRTVLLSDRGDLSDGQLLAQFVSQHDEDAFTALMRRHGPMVLGVCGRLLGNVHDADDAFQATFPPRAGPLLGRGRAPCGPCRDPRALGADT